MAVGDLGRTDFRFQFSHRHMRVTSPRSLDASSFLHTPFQVLLPHFAHFMASKLIATKDDILARRCVTLSPVIYEAGPRSSHGGIWAHVNKTSGLQLNSLLYRFHPAVLGSRAFPLRDEIVGEIERIWKEYHLEPRTRFETRVTSVKRAEPCDAFAKEPDRSRWIINDVQTVSSMLLLSLLERAAPHTGLACPQAVAADDSGCESVHPRFLSRIYAIRTSVQLLVVVLALYFFTSFKKRLMLFFWPQYSINASYTSGCKL